MKIILGVLLCSLALAAAHGQAPQEKDYSIKVGVEEVRIDAVVLDKKGRQVADLTAKDFELFQDGKLQKITSCIYMTDSQTPSKRIPSPEASKAELLVSKPISPRDKIQRTIAFVVDDKNLIFADFQNARMALQIFVETEMALGDLVTILQSSGGVGAQQKLTSDKRQLLSRIKSMACHESGCENTGAGTAGQNFLANAELAQPGYGHVFALDASLSQAQRDRVEYRNNHPSLGMLGMNRYDPFYIRRIKFKLSVLRYAIAVLRDMPGRKSLVFMTSGISFNADMAPAMEFERLFNEAADEALRAGVVIFTLDMRGLTLYKKTTSGSDKHLPMSQKTGGISVENSNFFLHGIKPVEEALSGYYLLSYIPPANTFGGNRAVYHPLRVKVKRPGVEVHSRAGFFGISSPPNIVSNPNSLQQAIDSPFLYNDLELRLSSSYAYSPIPGYFVRSWLHLDGKDLIFIDEQNGAHSLSLELAIMTSNSMGIIQDAKTVRRGFSVNDEDISRIREEGINLNTYLPVKKSGDYYIRAAIKDRASGKVGSGYQFLSIPDLDKERLSLSSIFVLNHGEDGAVIKSGNIEGSGESSEAQKWYGLSKSPALRVYRPGDSFDYIMVVYNAKAKETPRLEFQPTIFKDGQIYYRGKAEDIDLSGADDLDRIPIMKTLVFSSTMNEGEYLFQLMVKDKQASENAGVAVQAIDFQIQKDSYVR